MQAAEHEGLTLAPERLRLQRLEHLAPQRHQFLRQAELSQALEPLRQQIGQQAAQQIDLQQRHEQLQQQLLDAGAALAVLRLTFSELEPPPALLADAINRFKIKQNLDTLSVKC